MFHICSKVKCLCGCEYCAYDYNGCPQCGKGKSIFTTSSTSATATCICGDPIPEPTEEEKEQMRKFLETDKIERIYKRSK